ncbi:MAG: DMT family transporter [Cyanobacteria bacterium J069]
MALNFSNPGLAKSPLALVAPFFFLGTAMVVMKFVLPHTTPLFLAGFRLLPAGLLVLLIGAIAKLPQPKGWKAWGWISLFGLVDGALFQGFLTEGLVHTGAGLGAVLIDAQPMLVAVLSRFILNDVIGLWGWLGLAIGVLGVALCGLPEAAIQSVLQGSLSLPAEAFTWETLMRSGELLMILAALAMSFGTIIVTYVRQHADPIMGTGWHMIIGAVPLLALSALTEAGQVLGLHGGDWAGLGYTTIFGTAITYGMFFYLAATGNVTSVSALIFLTPVFALLFSSLTLGEQLTHQAWIGVVLTLISVYLVNQRHDLAARFAKPSMLSEPLPEGVVEVATVNIQPKSDS